MECERHGCIKDATETFDGKEVCSFHYATMRRGMYR